MKLFYAPGACSIGIHVLLEEIGKPYEPVLLNTKEGAQFKPEFTSLNPKSKVPTLVRDDGSVLTEYPAIALWLASTFPEAKLLPQGAEGLAKALEYTNDYWHLPEYNVLLDILQEEVSNAISGKKTVQEATTWADEQINTILNAS